MTFWRSLAHRLQRLDGASRNYAAVFVQQIISAGALFISYRIFLGKEGIEGLGLWSVLVATTVFGRLGDVSGATALARFVSMQLRTAECSPRVDHTIHTTVLVTLVVNAFLGAGSWAVVYSLLGSFLPPSQIDPARILLPYVFINGFIFSPVASALCSGLDGFQRADLRAYVVSISSICSCVASIFAISFAGSVGFAFAQALQQVLIIGLCWAALRSLTPIGFFPYKFDYEVFSDTISYGLKLQSISVATLLTEPVVKLVLNETAGAAFVGCYELGLRFLNQLRTVFVAPAQPLIAVFAPIVDPDRIQKLLTLYFHYYLAGGILFCVIANVGLPFYSQLVLGEKSADLAMVVAIISVGFSVNIFAVPIYFAALGRGKTRWNFYAQMIPTILVILLGYPFAYLSGPTSVLLLLSFALLLSSFANMIGNCDDLGLSVVTPYIAIGAALSSLLVLNIAFFSV